MPNGSVLRWVMAVVVALAIVALIADARGNPGDDGRVGDTESSLGAPGVLDGPGA